MLQQLCELVPRQHTALVRVKSAQSQAQKFEFCSRAVVSRVPIAGDVLLEPDLCLLQLHLLLVLVLLPERAVLRSDSSSRGGAPSDHAAPPVLVLRLMTWGMSTRQIS